MERETKKEQGASPAHTGPGAEAGPYAQCRILITDDQASVATFIERVVRARLGCEVVIARDGDEAFAQFASENFDVMLADMMMPGLHGLDLLRAAKSTRPEMDIIVMTAYPADFPYVDVLQAGAEDFMHKPFASGELEAKLIRLLNARAVRRERTMAERKYRSLFDLSVDGMVLIEEDSFVIADANNTFCELTGMTPESLAGKSVLDLMVPEERGRFGQWLPICLSTGRGVMGDLKLHHASGAHLSVDVSMTAITGQPGKIVFLSFKDLTEKREVERQLADAAEKDGLTGLLNKRSFHNRIEWAVGQAKMNGTPLSLLLMDLDNFKQCNDTHGHQAGDTLLSSVGDVVRQSIRARGLDDGFRYGGDEFAVILDGTNDGGAQVVARRLQTKFQGVETYGTTMSIGITEYRPGDSAEAFVRHADEALYQAKALGKNAIQVA